MIKILIAIGLFVGTVNAQVVVGRTTIATQATLRTLVVAQDGTGNFVTIQAASAASLPGDLIEVKSGTYQENLNISNSGTATHGIVYQPYPGNAPVLRPPGTTAGSELVIAANWIIFQGFEITNGWDGAIISGSNDALENNFIHNNGDSCDFTHVLCGEGVIVQNHDVLISGNKITQNGSKDCSPKNMNGVFIEDVTSCNCIANVSVMGNTVTHQSGAGIMAQKESNLLIQSNTLAYNVYEIVFQNVTTGETTLNAITHTPQYPITDSLYNTMFSFTASTGISVDHNTLNYLFTIPQAGKDYVLYLPFGVTGISGDLFANNTWTDPCGYQGATLTDAAMNAML